MKSFLFISILIFAFCVAAFAQTDKIPLCPSISVTGPAGVPKPDEPIVFTGILSKEADKFNLQ